MINLLSESAYIAQTNKIKTAITNKVNEIKNALARIGTKLGATINWLDDVEITLDDELTAINTELTDKGSTQANDFSEVAEKISKIQTGITPTGEIAITQNGTYDVTDYASASVAVQKYSIFTYNGNNLNTAAQVDSFVRTLLPTKGSVTLISCKEQISDFSENELCIFTKSNTLNSTAATRVRSGNVQSVNGFTNAYDLVLENGMQFYLQTIEIEGAEE